MVTDVDFALNRGLDLCLSPSPLLMLHIPMSSAPRPRPFHSDSPLERMNVTSEFPQSKLGPQMATDFYQFEVTGLESRGEDTGHGLPLD